MGHALILGAASDIAKALAYQYAGQGYSLTLAARNSSQLADLVSDLQIRHQITAEAVEFDALDFAGHAVFYANLAYKPNVVICVFGYLGEQETAQKDFAEAERIIQTNYTGAVSILNIIANDFEQRRAGTIIGISSVAGDRGRQSNYIYGSAKAGFTAYLSGLRNRLTKAKVQVITVKPGFVRTKMTRDLKLPKPLTAAPAQVARAVFTAQRKGQDILYVLPVWRLVMFAIRHLPEPIFKKLKL